MSHILTTTYPANTAKQSKIIRKNQEVNTPTILQRISDSDKTAYENCVDVYGNMVWAMAKKFTVSTQEAEKAVQEIFVEIWKNACKCDSTKTDERDFIALLAYKYLLKNALKKSAFR